jgi:hypothetical protein
MVAAARAFEDVDEAELLAVFSAEVVVASEQSWKQQ